VWGGRGRGEEKKKKKKKVLAFISKPMVYTFSDALRITIENIFLKCIRRITTITPFIHVFTAYEVVQKPR
jgi:hypothetical protein